MKFRIIASCLLFLAHCVRGLCAPGDENWDPRFAPPPGIVGQVFTITSKGNDLYIGGRFAYAGGVRANSIARWDGTNWFPLNGGVDGTVFTLTVFGTDLCVGGVFSVPTASGTAINVARWSGSAWESIGPNITEGDIVSDVYVSSLVVFKSQLIAAGSFKVPGATNSHSIARWTGDSWEPLGLGLSFNTTQWPVLGRVETTLVADNDLYVGGRFARAGDIAATNLARWDGTNWHTVGGGIGGGLGEALLIESKPHPGLVTALGTRNGELYVAGDFTLTGGTAATNFAKWTGSEWLQMERPEGFIYKIATFGTNEDLYIGGEFGRIGDVEANSVARWTGDAWHPVGSGVSGSVSTLFQAGTNLLAGGDFSSVGGVSAGGLALWNNSSWLPFGDGSGKTIVGEPSSVVATDTAAYVAGRLVGAGTNQIRHVARWNGTNWSAAGWLPKDTFVSRVTANDQRICVLEGNDRHVLVLEETNWTVIGQFAPPYAVTDCAWAGEKLYVCGYFSSVDGLPIKGLAVYQPGGGWSEVPNPGNINRLATSGSNVYVAGQFTYLGGVTSKNIACWNGVEWIGLDGGVAGYIQAMAVQGTNLVVAGQFVHAGSSTVTNIALWNGLNWTDLGRPFSSGETVLALAISGRNIYVAGRFNQVAGKPARNIAKWDGVKWSALGSGAGVFDSDYITGLAANDHQLFVVGRFFSAGGLPAHNFAVWNEPTAWLFNSPRWANGEFRFDVSGVVGKQFRIEASEDLQNWNVLATSTLSTNGMGFIDTTASGTARRFYRLFAAP